MSGSAILTNNGLLKIASASPLDQLTITQIAIGDGVNPLDPNSTALVNEVYRDAASTPIRSTTYPNTLVFELNIPPTTGGFTCREIGAFDTDGDLIAVGTLDELVKPTDGINYVARINVKLANTAQVDVFYDNQGAIDFEGLRNRSSAVLKFNNVTEMINSNIPEGAECSTGGSNFKFNGGARDDLDNYKLIGIADVTDFIGDLTDDTTNAVILADLLQRYNKVTIPYGYDVFSSDIAVTLSKDTDLMILGNLYFTGDVASSYTPIAFDIDCGGYDFKIGGGGYIDFENHDAPIIRRRLLDINNAADVQVYGYKSRSCKTIIQSFTGNVTKVRFKSPATTVHQADGTGLISVNFKQGGDVKVNTLVANIDNQAEVVDILKVTGGTNVVAEASKSVNVKDNFIHNLGGGNSEVDIFSGGRECAVDNNTLINVSIQTKNNYIPESIANDHIILSKNKFFLDKDGMTLCIYRRSGKIKILDNFFIARSDQTLMDSVINLDKEDINSTVSKDDQGDVIINGNICDMRAITADNSTFSFVLTDTLVGTDLEKLHCIFSDNIVRGCNGLMRGNMFSNSVCSGGVFDMAGKANYSTGNFTFKKIDGLTISSDTPYLLTNTPTVQNSPRVAMRNYYSDAALVSGELDIKERDVFVLTDGNLNGTAYIDSIKNHTIKQFVIINRSSSTVTISLAGDQSRSLSPLGQILVMPYNDSDFTETRIRFKATIF